MLNVVKKVISVCLYLLARFALAGTFRVKKEEPVQDFDDMDQDPDQPKKPPKVAG
jgi:hypothetical protein